jgi:hypothetical protein
MANGYQQETIYDETYEASYDEAWGDPEAYEPEARGRARPSPARPPGNYVPPQPATSQYVTQQQLQTALAGVRQDMQKNATAISAIGSQVDALSTRTRRDIGRLRDEFKNTTQMLMLLPLLTQQKSLTVPRDIAGVGGAPGAAPAIPANTKLATASDGFSAMLPLLLLSGGLGGGSTGGSGQDNNMMMLVLAMTMMNK